MSKIHTREQLFHEIQQIISSHVHGDCWECIDKSAEEICDLIANLPNLCFHSKNEKCSSNSNSSTVL